MSDTVETVNGETPLQEYASNRAFLYGDGVFTTLKLENSEPRDAQLHWQRLRADSRKLKITTPKFEFFEHCLRRTLLLWQHSEGIIRISVYRSGGRGYRGSHNENGDVHISIQPFAELIGITRLQTVNTRLSRNESTAGIKHLNRIEQVLIAAELDDCSQEAVVLDTEGFVIEALMSNIFWFEDNVFYTPQLDYSGVNGLARRKLIQGLQKRKRQLKIDFFNLGQLMQAESVWICNALRGVQEVAQIDSRTFAPNMETTLLLNNIFIE